MTHYVYTKRDHGFQGGRQYRNPRRFERPYPDATTVEVEGDYPHIVKAYQDVGVEVIGANTRSSAHLDAEPSTSVPDDDSDKQAMLDTLAERGIHKDMRSSVSTLRRLIAETEDQDDAD